jgi:hypothetical protein
MQFRANIDAIEMVSVRKTLHPASILPKPSLDLPELLGVAPTYSVIHSLRIGEGRFFTDADEAASSPVCVIGDTAKVSILGFGPAKGKYIKVNTNWLQVVGVLKEQLVAGSTNRAGFEQHHLIPRSTFSMFLGPMRCGRTGRREVRCGGQHRSGQSVGAEFDAPWRRTSR